MNKLRQLSPEDNNNHLKDGHIQGMGTFPGLLIVPDMGIVQVMVTNIENVTALGWKPSYPRYSIHSKDGLRPMDGDCPTDCEVLMILTILGMGTDRHRGRQS